MELILASQSPRRRQLLEEQGYKTDVHPAQISESISAALPLDEALERLALDKARAVRPGFPDRTIIAADTVVVYDGEILGKPADDREACDFLMRLSGETHQVKTGVCILTPGMEITFTDTTDVRFRVLEDQEILAYTRSGKSADKAGAYGIQDSGFVESIHGSWSNVVGLPMEKVNEILHSLPKKGCTTTV
ncbi:nucleoside triphosphate pyrophosphatase [uncultured Faecalibaculum sp.]|uniref:Maf family protein n=2 Tax=uncultured Faecalibaculum sp. TaxID=1729681 RepID=UPI002608DBAF|nr:Maf family protein [uncultured Faecalibaculum sp.]